MCGVLSLAKKPHSVTCRTVLIIDLNMAIMVYSVGDVRTVHVLSSIVGTYTYCIMLYGNAYVRTYTNV